jgi:hypothetical protein
MSNGRQMHSGTSPPNGSFVTTEKLAHQLFKLRRELPRATVRA